VQNPGPLDGLGPSLTQPDSLALADY